MTATLVIGIGHSFRTDDSIGPVLAQLVAEQGRDHVQTQTHHGEGTGLMELWSQAQTVILIDATCSDAPAGTIRVWDAVAAPLPAGLFPTGSHLFGVAEGVELARRLDRLPRALTVVGIEGKDFSAGEGLSPAVADSLPAALDRILALINR